MHFLAAPSFVAYDTQMHLAWDSVVYAIAVNGYALLRRALQVQTREQRLG